ncbi:15018_t:CDS:2 [Dentiscutata erythropus]|uniref:15018_t:CDS:1 n=1 Tax=Dentiscutata erythropus TaxID=1348616 RepID=A0A9N9FHD1_9GLOM|nr:15018_t:CDS:2 [Dentiscutata erythropus]
MASRNSVFQKFLRKVFIRRRKKPRSRFSRSSKRPNERLTHNNVTNNDNNTFRVNNMPVNNEEKNYLTPLNINTPDRTSTGLCRDWRSGNKIIDDLIQLIRLQYPHPAHNLNWIPYEEFANCEHIANGGFSTIYKATWTTSGQTVTLKSLNNSQDISINYLNEIKANWDLFSQPQFLHCHDVFSRKDGLAPAHNNIRTHPDAVYLSKLLDFPELRGTTRRRQHLSLNIPRSVSEGSSNDLSQQPTQPSQDNPKHLLSSGNLSNSKSFRNTYNHPPTNKDTREISRDVQGYESGRPEIGKICILVLTPKLTPELLTPEDYFGIFNATPEHLYFFKFMERLEHLLDIPR